MVCFFSGAFGNDGHVINHAQEETLGWQKRDGKTYRAIELLLLPAQAVHAQRTATSVNSDKTLVSPQRLARLL